MDDVPSLLEDAVPPSGYTLVLPPQWTKIPLRHGTDGAIKAIVDRATEGSSRDEAATARRELTVHLREQVAAAARGGGLDLYLPTELMHGFRLGASFVVAEVAFGTEQFDPAMLVARLAAESDAATGATLGGSLAVRTETITEADAVTAAARQVSYVAAVPHDPDRWVLVTFSTVGQCDPRDELADLGVELFDAILSTFRWTYAASNEHTNSTATISVAGTA